MVVVLSSLLLIDCCWLIVVVVVVDRGGRQYCWQTINNLRGGIRVIVVPVVLRILDC
jgi:hypothetical protein